MLSSLHGKRCVEPLMEERDPQQAIFVFVRFELRAPLDNQRGLFF